jgi:type I restriction enzyme S subunit
MILNEVCELIVDCEHKTAPTQEEGYPSIRTPNIGRGYLLLDEVNRVSEETYRKWTARAVPQYGDLIMAREAPVGNVAMVPQGLRPCLGQRTLLIRPIRSKVAPRYLAYMLVGDAVQNKIHAMTNGVTVPHLNMKDVRSLPLPPLPSLPTQRKIAAILSAYDDLIENNLRRIKILEEMAQNLYREWFVKFRFPGHENARFTDSPLGPIPEGWEVREMQEIAEVIDCLHSKKPQHNELGTGILLQLCNIGDGGKIDLSDKFLITNDDYQKWTSRIEVQAGDCVVTNVGRVGAVAQIPIGLKAAIGRNMTAVRPFAVGPTYLIEYLLSPHMIKEVQIKKDAGAIMDSLNVKGIVKLLVPIGPRTLMDLFEENARPMRALIERLFEKNTNLRRTRDLLLPRLISGEVDVSELDIVVSQESEA